MKIISFSARQDYKKHVCFGHSFKGDSVTYCGVYYTVFNRGFSDQNKCKLCTKQLRRAGMSWRWYESQK